MKFIDEGGNEPTKKDDDGITLCWYKSKHKHVLAAAIVALWSGLSQRTFCVKDDFLVFSADKMVNDVGRRCVTTRVAKPLGTDEALDDRGRRVNATVAVNESVESKCDG